MIDVGGLRQLCTVTLGQVVLGCNKKANAFFPGLGLRPCLDVSSLWTVIVEAREALPSTHCFRSLGFIITESKLGLPRIPRRAVLCLCVLN